MADADNTQATGGSIAAPSAGPGKIIGIALGLFVLMIASQLTSAILAKNFLANLVYPEGILALEVTAEETEETLGPAIYSPINPSIVVSYQEGSSTRFLQVSVEAMARDDESIAAFQANLPQIRNNLLMLFASQDLEELSSREGKEMIREASLKEVQSVLDAEHTGARIEEVFFTNFVVQ